MHMQDAWVVDQRAAGSWDQIGYVSPTSKNVSYSGTPNWVAEPKTGWAPGCTKWQITVGSASTGKATYTPATTGDKCSNLTPNFSSIGGSES
ncbi:MAG: hypothetical protein IKB43_09735 [Fibrobacter sp.]|nr:hypothetical protein [Fibrobacter sp.]